VALSLAFARAGRSIPARMAMMAITTKSSIKVKACGFEGDVGSFMGGKRKEEVISK
jgi:hypothetical protein